MFDYIPDVFKDKYATTEEEADRWYDDPDNNRRPPELLPRDEVARAINSEVKAGRGSPHGGVFLDIASPPQARARSSSGCRRCTTSSRSWPTSTSPPSRWRSARPATTSWAASRSTPTRGAALGAGPVRGRRGRPAACTAPTVSAATPCPTCWSSAGGPAWAPPSTSTALDGRPGAPTPRSRRRWPRRSPRTKRDGGENPYAVHQELQQTMNDLVGIIRREDELEQAIEALGKLRSGSRTSPSTGGRELQPRLAPGPRPAQHAARLRVRRDGRPRARGEPRRSHPRRLPGMSAEWRKVNLVCSPPTSATVSSSSSSQDAADARRPDRLFEVDELKKYLLTEERGSADR